MPVPLGVLFVCLGNICRSPTAEAVMRELVRGAGMEDSIEVDSAGTGAWHVGHSPDPRAAAAARGRGIVLSGEARAVAPSDFEDFDLILAMDRAHLRDLLAMAPEGVRGRVRLLREFDPAAPATPAGGDLDVPDPYHGGARGFEEVLDMVQASCAGLLEEIRPSRVP